MKNNNIIIKKNTEESQLKTTIFESPEDGEPQLWKYKGFDDCDSCFWKTGYHELIELICEFIQNAENINSRRY